MTDQDAVNPHDGYKALKIALVILHADSSRGAERYTLDLAAGLVERGHDVSVLASSFQSQPLQGKRVLLKTTGATRTGHYHSFLRALDAELERTSFDVVHAMLPVRRCDLYHPHAGIAAEAVAAGHLTKSGPVNRAFSWMGNRLNIKRNAFAKVEKNLLTSTFSPTVFCLSNLIREVVRQYYPALPESKLVPLFNGIDLHRFQPAHNRAARAEVRARFSLSDKAVVGLMLAQDFERKGLAQAIEALARIKDKNLFLLVGGKPDPSAYKKLASALGVMDQVHFAGPVSVPADFYQSSDFFVLPTRFDPCSLVVLEALAMGLPVISTVQNGACEVMQNHVHGFILNDRNDISQLAHAMGQMLDESQRRRMSDACVNLRPTISQSVHIDRLEQTYCHLEKQTIK